MVLFLSAACGRDALDEAPPSTTTAVRLNGAPWPVTSAIYMSFQWGFAPVTVVLFSGASTKLCMDVSNTATTCNAKLMPDVELNGIGFARPSVSSAEFGWLGLRDSAAGSTNLAPDLFGSHFGASLTPKTGETIHGQQNSATIERIVFGGEATFTFDSVLTTGAHFEGRVVATWCPALAAEFSQRFPANVGGSASYQYDDASNLKHASFVGTCETQQANAECDVTPSDEATCSCELPHASGEAGQRTSCTTTKERLWQRSCCPMRFGDPR